MNTRGGGRWSRESKLTSAWAGNLTSRVGREHVVYVQDKAKSAGSSPRGRGTPPACPCRWHWRREIPAWAGNTPPQRSEVPSWPGDPRVGGEHSFSGFTSTAEGGRSPRGRGTLDLLVGDLLAHREIPAWAGNTTGPEPSARYRSGDPRVGGEHRPHRKVGFDKGGRSPRGRGTHLVAQDQGVRGREIPAWAGNTTATSR